MSTKKLALAFAGLAVVCAWLSSEVSERFGAARGAPTAAAAATRASGPGYGSYLQVVGIKPMDYDAANKGARRDGDAWVLGAVDLEAVRAAAAEPEDLNVLAAADPKWIPTQTWKLAHGGASPFAIAKEHCSARHLAQMEVLCKADISVVVERQSTTDGHVVYAKPTLGADATDDCRAYADCIARNAWLDRPTPLPPGHSTYHAFQAGDVRLPMHGTKEEWQVSLRSEIELVSDNLTALRRLDLSDPQIRQSLELQQDLLEQLEVDGRLVNLLRRHRALLAGLVSGFLVVMLAAWLLDPSRWLRPELGRVYVIGTCSYSKAALDILRADPDAPFVPLALPANVPEFEADACDLARARLRRAGAFWLAVLPADYVCRRLRDHAAAQFAVETTGEGYPAWVGGDGEFLGLGVDPRQISALRLTPPPAIVRFWIEGGYDRALVESLGFAVPEGTVQGPRVPPPPLTATAP